MELTRDVFGDSFVLLQKVFNVSPTCLYHFVSDGWSEVVDACIWQHNIGAAVSAVDMNSCKESCMQQEGCCSIDYIGALCSLNDVIGENAGTAYEQPCSSSSVSYKYSQRTSCSCKLIHAHWEVFFYELFRLPVSKTFCGHNIFLK